MDVSNLRRDYSLAGLAEADALADPFAQFQAWFADVLEGDRHDPTAMTLATADAEGRPSARIVLLKGYDERGFVFFSNYGSRKGRELEANPRAALVFYWPDFDRQVRVEGTVERVSREESEEYFRSRPLGSRLGAWASPQSSVISGREELERRLREVEERFLGGGAGNAGNTGNVGNADVPVPDFWGGYRLSPEVIEFWQGRPSRLHDRLRYTRLSEEGWKIERLSP